MLLAPYVSVLHSADSIEEAARDATSANINAVLVFSTQHGLNSGAYNFRAIDARLQTLHVSGYFELEPYSDNINFVFGGGVGYSQTSKTGEWNQTVPSSPGTLTHTNLLRTYTGSLGGGIQYHNQDGFELAGVLELIYSRMGFVKGRDDFYDELINDLFKKEFIDNLTFNFSGMARYRREWFGFFPYVVTLAEVYETKNDFSFSGLSRFTTQASVLSAAIGAESPPLLHHKTDYLTLEGYVRGSLLGGDLPKTVAFDRYATLGAVAYWYVPEKLKYIRRFFLEASVTQGKALDGYNIGFGFSPAFSEIYDAVFH